MFDVRLFVQKALGVTDSVVNLYSFQDSSHFFTLFPYYL